MNNVKLFDITHIIKCMAKRVADQPECLELQGLSSGRFIELLAPDCSWHDNFQTTFHISLIFGSIDGPDL